MKNFILQAIFWVLFAVAFVGGIMYATSAEYWYAGEHDAYHEGENCKCYERLSSR